VKLIKRITILSAVLALGILPSVAGFNGEVSKNHFYDTEKTIMVEAPLNKTLTTGKYWEKNLFYFNKYRPLFMLSNKELYDLMPKENVSVVQRITTPTVYNISLKSASIKNVSFEEPYSLKPKDEPKTSEQQVDEVLKSEYKRVKNSDMDSDKKIDMAVLLKQSKNPYNYPLAIDLLNDVTRQEPYNAYAFYLKGELYLAQKDSGNAMKNYVQSLKINPTSKQCCLGIAKILEPTNKELAQKYYNKAK